MTLSAIILTGGRASRFAGVHKPGVELGGRTVVSRLLAAVRAVDPDAEVVVAGRPDGLDAEEAETVRIVREQPEFAGPLAGIAAGSAVISSADPTDVSLVIAGDMPMVTATHLVDLVEECARTGRPITGTDDRGKAQFLCAAWPTELLRTRLKAIGEPTDKAVKLLFGEDEPIIIDVNPDVVVDFDTAEELARIRSRFSDD